MFQQRGAYEYTYGVIIVSRQDRDYYLARIAAEREAAERATNDHVRRVHLELADQYQEMLDGRRPKAPPEEPGVEF